MNMTRGVASIRSRLNRRGLALLLIIGGAHFARAAEVAKLELLRPTPYEVVQRQGFEPRGASVHEPGGPAIGFALVPIEVNLPASAGDWSEYTTYEYRTVPLVDVYGTGTDWTVATGKCNDKQWASTVRVPGGGWYRLELRVRLKGQDLAFGQVEPFGVGEVFVIAGQSYAVGANDESMKVDDPQGTSSLMMPSKRSGASPTTRSQMRATAARFGRSWGITSCR